MLQEAHSKALQAAEQSHQRNMEAAAATHSAELTRLAEAQAAALEMAHTAHATATQRADDATTHGQTLATSLTAEQTKVTQLQQELAAAQAKLGDVRAMLAQEVSPLWPA